jgi:hypothetical protein
VSVTAVPLFIEINQAAHRIRVVVGIDILQIFVYLPNPSAGQQHRLVSATPRKDAILRATFLLVTLRLRSWRVIPFVQRIYQKGDRSGRLRIHTWPTRSSIVFFYPFLPHFYPKRLSLNILRRHRPTNYYDQMEDSMSNYADLGVKHVINAWGPMTIIGSARVRPEVVAAMAQAAAAYVDLIELQRAAGRRLAQLVGVEACYIAGGCAAGLAIATAACMTGGEPARVARLPTTSGMKGEVMMQRSHRNPYDHAYTQVGARIIEIGHAWQAFDWELEAAIGPQTAAVIYVYTQRTMSLPLSLPETVAIRPRARGPGHRRRGGGSAPFAESAWFEGYRC